MKRLQAFLLRILAPTVVQIGDVVLTRSGYAYWVQPGKLQQMRVISVHKVKLTEDEENGKC